MTWTETAPRRYQAGEYQIEELDWFYLCTGPGFSARYLALNAAKLACRAHADLIMIKRSLQCFDQPHPTDVRNAESA